MLHNQGSGQNNEAPPNGGETTQVLGQRGRDDDNNNEGGNLYPGPSRRVAQKSDPLVGHGRHFGRTIHGFCRIFPLVKEGLLRQIDIQAGLLQLSELTDQEQHEQLIYTQLKRLAPGLDVRLVKASTEELIYVTGTLEHGVTRARTDDVKSMKGAIIEWITPRGGALIPGLCKNKKSDRGFFHYRTGELLCPPMLDWTDPSIRERLKTGELVVSVENWPSFIYEESYDREIPWGGLWRGDLLVKGYKHVFTSPSSVEESTRATRAGNAEINGMRSVTLPSLAYIATLVRFSLGSDETLALGNVMSDSEKFYRGVLEFLEDPDEKEEVDGLLKWWNVKIFPRYHVIHGDTPEVVPTVKGRIQEWRNEQRRRRALADIQVNPQQGSSRGV